MGTHVITAGPSAGKSSTIRALSAEGYQTLPEAARMVLEQGISEGKDPSETRDEENFQEHVEEIDRKIESKIDSERETFLDRSLADNVAYRSFYGKPVPDELREEVQDRYDTVFVLERIEFKDDDVRSEDDEEAEAIHEKLIETYKSLGYDPIIVPLCPIDERVEFIENLM